MSRAVIFKPQDCWTIWHSEFIGDLVLVTCCPFEGGRPPVDALAHRTRHQGDVSIMVSGSPGFGERTTRGEVRRVEASNRQQTNYFGNREKAPVVRGGSDKAVVVEGTGRTRDSGTATIGFAGTPTRGGRTSARAKDTTPTWLEEVPSRRDQGIGNGTEHPNLWTQRQAPGDGGVGSRLAALVRETDRHGNGATRSVRSGRAGRRDSRIGTEQSEFPETPTGSDGRGHLHDSDGSKTLKTICLLLGSSR